MPGMALLDAALQDADSSHLPFLPRRSRNSSGRSTRKGRGFRYRAPRHKQGQRTDSPATKHRKLEARQDTQAAMSINTRGYAPRNASLPTTGPLTAEDECIKYDGGKRSGRIVGGRSKGPAKEAWER